MHCSGLIHVVAIEREPAEEGRTVRGVEAFFASGPVSAAPAAAFLIQSSRRNVAGTADDGFPRGRVEGPASPCHPNTSAAPKLFSGTDITVC